MSPTAAIVMGEYGTDPDEILSLILATRLCNLNYLDLTAVVGNHHPAKARAMQAKATLRDLGFGHVPVGMGEAGFSASGPGHETDPRFLSVPTQIQHGRDMLRWTLEQAEDNSVVLVLNSGFTDAVWLWLDRPDLFLQKIQRVIIMGGVETQGNQPRLSSEGHLVPSLGRGGAANNCFDPGATLHLFDALQRHGVPMVITIRHAAYQAKLPFRLFQDLADTGHPIGVKLNERQNASINGLWHKVNAPAGSEVRGTLPVDRNVTWFASTFCDGELPPISAAEDVTPYIRWITLYDPLNMIAAIPALSEQYYTPHRLEVQSQRGLVAHDIIGLTAQMHGVTDPDGLREFIRVALTQSLLPIASY